MSPLILRRVKSARRRLNWINLMQKTLRALFIGLIAAAAYMLLTRVRDVGLVEYAWPGVGAALLVSLLAALVWAFFTRIDDAQAALAVDARLGLRERISTALYYARPKTALERMVLEDAERHAERIHPRTDFQLALRRRHYWSLLPAILIGSLSFVPPVALFKENQNKDAQLALTPVQTEVIQRIEKASRDFEEDRSRPETEDLEQVEQELNELVKKFRIGKLSKPQMIGELSSLEDKLQERREKKEQQLNFRSAKDAAEKPEFTADVQDNMQEGKFKEAAIGLKQLQNKIEKQLQDGEFTADDRQQAAKELKSLAKQADPQSELGKALNKAAEAIESGDAEEMKQQLSEAMRDMQELDSLLSEIAAMQGMESLINFQKEALLNDSPRGKQGASKSAKGQQSQQGQQASQQAQGGRKGQDSGEGQQQAGEGREQSGQSQAEGSASQQGNSQSGDQSGGSQSSSSGSQGQSGDQSPGGQQASGGKCSNCGGALTNGQCSSCGGNNSSQSGAQGKGGGPQFGSSENPSAGGMRGPGQGRGGSAPFSNQQTAFVKEKLPQKMDVGEIIAIYKVNGPQIKGEANVEFQQIMENYHQQAEESLNREEIPLHLRGFVGDYFDSIRGEQQQ